MSTLRGARFPCAIRRGGTTGSRRFRGRSRSRCARIWRRCGAFTTKIDRLGSAPWSCRRRSLGNFRMPSVSGFGSGSFRPPADMLMTGRGRSGGITCMSRRCSTRCTPMRRRRARHPDGAGVAGPSRCDDGDDLPARTAAWSEGRAKPAGRPMNRPHAWRKLTQHFFSRTLGQDVADAPLRDRIGRSHNVRTLHLVHFAR